MIAASLEWITKNIMEKYKNFEELKQAETEGVDYQVHSREGNSGIAVISPHGGGIEPGTTEIADRVAGDEHSFYSFEGWKQKGNAALHITSRRFDEPTGVRLAAKAETILTVHGCKGREKAVYIGGTDEDLMGKVRDALEDGFFPVQEHPRFPGTSPLNLCNRSRLCKGVQIEISAALRRSMFHNFSRPERKKTTRVFETFVNALKKGLSKP